MISHRRRGIAISIYLSIHLSIYLSSYPSIHLAFTRYCFTLKLYCGSPSSFYCPPHLQSLPFCITIARPLRKIRPPTDPSFVYQRHTILVMAIPCKGQPSIHPSIGLTSCHILSLSIYLMIYLSIYVFIYLPIHLSIYLSTYITTYIHLSIYL